MLNNSIVITLCACLFSIPAFAAQITNYDRDGDGLVEINSLQDLDSLHGFGEFTRAVSGICVVEENISVACRGYELTQDLDFDTNQDGKLDAQDTYWNDGKGWLPIKHYYYQLVFEGNGHVIRNLMINRPEANTVGLFDVIDNITFQRLGLTGPLTSVTGGTYAGLLAGSSYTVKFNQVFVTGRVSAQQAGGLVGISYYSILEDVFSSASVVGKETSGGLLGYDVSSNINRSYVIGPITPSRYHGGLVGLGSSSLMVDSYWAKDTTQVDKAWTAPSAELAVTDAKGVNLADLTCPTQAGDTQCVPGLKLFNHWDENSTGIPNWVFKGKGSLPALHLNGRLYRDQDANSEPDKMDSLDTDKDGVIDELDDFPKQAKAFRDNDQDGLVDLAAEGCETACLAAIGLKWDQYPNDTDNDAVPNDQDPDVTKDNSSPYAVAEIPTLSQIAQGVTTPIKLTAPHFAFQDAVDSQLTLQYQVHGPSINATDWQTANDSTDLALNSGTHFILWRAQDKAGNISETKQQLIHIFPAMGFEQKEYIVGEKAYVSPVLTSDTAFPNVSFTFKFQILKDQSTATEADFALSDQRNFDQLQSYSFETAQDNLAEPDEHLVIKLVSVTPEFGGPKGLSLETPVEKPMEIPIATDRQITTITVTDRNLAPSNIYISQNLSRNLTLEIWREVRHLFLLQAHANDPNGSDQHTFKWVGDGLVAITGHPDLMGIKPEFIKPGYTLTVTATDNGLPPLSTPPMKVMFRPTDNCENTRNIGANVPVQGVNLILNYDCNLWGNLTSSSLSSISSVGPVSSASSSSAKSSSASSVSSKSSSSKNASSTGSKTAGGSSSLWILGGLMVLLLLRRKKV